MNDDAEIPEIRSTFYIVQSRLLSGTTWTNEGYHSTADDAVKERDFLVAHNPPFAWRVVRRVTVTTQDVIG